MGLITADRALPGMVLSAAVTDRKGRRLIAEDVSLTERHIQALKMWGVTQIEVEGDGPDDGQRLELPPEVEARVRKDVEARFVDSEKGNAFIKLLMEAAVDRALQVAGSELEAAP